MGQTRATVAHKLLSQCNRHHYLPRLIQWDGHCFDQPQGMISWHSRLQVNEGQHGYLWIISSAHRRHLPGCFLYYTARLSSPHRYVQSVPGFFSSLLVNGLLYGD